MAPSRLELLRNMPIFGGLTDDSLTLLVELAGTVSIAAGGFFFRQGDDGKSTFVLETGSVEVLKACDGRQHSLSRLGVGDCFGEVALIDFGPRSASVQALADASALVLSSSNLLEISKRSLEQYAMIYMNMARELSRRLRNADDRLFEARVEARAPDPDYAFSPI
jgi:CRP/FNR family cyclic AMP-dependent transcriptional regulator